MSERPAACPACDGTVLIRSGHACGRQRWRCKGCGRQVTRTTPRGKSAAMKAAAVEFYCTGLSLSAVGKRPGVSAQSVMCWIRDHARRRCPEPEPAGRAAVVEIDEAWHFIQKRPASLGSGRSSSAALAAGSTGSAAAATGPRWSACWAGWSPGACACSAPTTGRPTMRPCRRVGTISARTRPKGARATMPGSGTGSPASAAAPASCPGRSGWSRRPWRSSLTTTATAVGSRQR